MRKHAFRLFVPGVLALAAAVRSSGAETRTYAVDPAASTVKIHVGKATLLKLDLALEFHILAHSATPRP